MKKQAVTPDDEKIMRDFAQILRELTNEDKRQVLGFAQGVSAVRVISPAPPRPTA